MNRTGLQFHENVSPIKALEAVSLASTDVDGGSRASECALNAFAGDVTFGARWTKYSAMTTFGAALRATSVGYAARVFDATHQLAEPKASQVLIMKNRGQRLIERQYCRGIRRRLAIVFGATVAIPAMAFGDPDAGHIERTTVGATAVSVEIPEAQFVAGTESLLAWIRRSMNIVSAYYGRFPSRALRIKLVADDGSGVHTGTTWGKEGGFIRLKVGRDITDNEMLNDWVLVHEMTHLALPDVGEEHAWLSEGLAVYIEGVERVQAGNRSEEDVFAEELRSMPRGLPEPGDRKSVV